MLPIARRRWSQPTLFPSRAISRMYLGGPWVMTISTFGGMMEVVVPTFLAQLGVLSGGLYRSSSVAY